MFLFLETDTLSCHIYPCSCPFGKKKKIIIIQKREEKENTLSISYIVLALR